MLFERRRSCADALRRSFARADPRAIAGASARNRAKRPSLPPVAGAPAGATAEEAASPFEALSRELTISLAQQNLWVVDSGSGSRPKL